MTNRNSMKQSYDCILSADGKAFSYTEILNLIRSMANYFANKRGHSMNQDHIDDLVGLVEEKVAEQLDEKSLPAVIYGDTDVVNEQGAAELLEISEQVL